MQSSQCIPIISERVFVIWCQILSQAVATKTLRDGEVGLDQLRMRCKVEDWRGKELGLLIELRSSYLCKMLWGVAGIGIIMKMIRFALGLTSLGRFVR